MVSIQLKLFFPTATSSASPSHQAGRTFAVT